MHTSPLAALRGPDFPRQHPHRAIPDGGSPGAPHSVWIAPPRAIRAPLAKGSELPVWAFQDAVAEYAPRGGAVAILHGPRAALVHDAVEPSSLAPAWVRNAERADLDTPDAGPLTLVVVLEDPAGNTDADAHQDAAFYREIHDELSPGAFALVHTHTTPTRNGLLDPGAGIVRAATQAGLGYVQHIVIVHTRLDAPTTTRYRPPAQAPAPPACRRVHSDLYAFQREMPDAEHQGDAR